MNTITIEEWYLKLEEHTDPVTGEVCPNKVIVEPGKPIVVAAFYNYRWYYWELIQ